MEQSYFFGRDDAMRIGFIGAGKVGYALGGYFARHGVNVTGYMSQHIESAEIAAFDTGTRVFTNYSDLLEASDAIFVTVPDSAIRSVYEDLKEYDLTGRFLIHTSGAMTVEDAFPQIEATGAIGYTVHPLFPFNGRDNLDNGLTGAFFCLQGDSSCMEMWTELLSGVGFRPQVIPGDKKVRYHLACAMASNLYCGLVYESQRLLMDCGFTEESAMEALAPLMEANLQGIIKKGPLMALTGPVERCDASTVSKHVDEVSGLHFPEDHQVKDLYQSVTRVLIEMAEKRHPDRDYQPLKEIMKDEGVR
ncbi:MAG TPA: DUF2520 domain-containing protein [Lachnospiraceae bacterium]|jgi:predicted short-subunit dehydrogenase-like oxidoreductase (DUF2520 family)|nr:DUF2520 domain-containing protein [Lachnospiraceae bacterium]HBE07775.1 DUF2520 domain-containing protein [Lachnospiraceae bacterium]